jgi:N-acetylated-alpha-linked acidic dipeptidase
MFDFFHLLSMYVRLSTDFKIMHAQYYGAVGAILYNDPADYAPFGITPDQVYDQKWFMPPSGIQRGSTFTMNGDPLTPIYPSTGARICFFRTIC